MRNTDEQLREIALRAAGLKRERRSRRLIAAEALSVCVCAALLVAVSLLTPRVEGAAVSSGSTGHLGSLILTAPWLGYVIISVLAFLLGICVTLLCLHLRRRKESERK